MSVVLLSLGTGPLAAPRDERDPEVVIPAGKPDYPGMDRIRYSKEHEWVRHDGDVATVGISNYAAEQLGDVVYVELPEIGRRVEKGEEAAVVESVKAASEVYSPLSGEIIDVNVNLEGTPSAVNQDAEGGGWFFKLKIGDAEELNELLTDEQYKHFLETIS